MKSYIFYLLSLPIFFLACQTDDSKELLISDDFQKALQEKLINAQDGATIELPEGTFELTKSLSLEGLSDITIKGKGRDQTILSFKGQEEGSEGLYISNVKNIVLSDFTIQDAKGDNIKIIHGNGVVIRNVNATWTGGAKESNGAYAIYPVECQNVLIEDSEASFASDAGIYVGQSINVVVRRCYAHHNVAGIEIENCINSDVYSNESINNTGGILIFDLPDLVLKNGRNTRVFNNTIVDNNHKNFAPKGNIVATIPPGTGIIVLATDSVEIFQNEITNHKSVGIAIASYLLTERPIKDSLYNPYTNTIYIRDNKISTNKNLIHIDKSTSMGKMILATFRKPMDIIYDGIADPKYTDEDGMLPQSRRICIRNNGENINFGNLNAHKAEGLTDLLRYSSTDISPYDCEHKGITGKNTPAL